MQRIGWRVNEQEREREGEQKLASSQLLASHATVPLGPVVPQPMVRSWQAVAGSTCGTAPHPHRRKFALAAQTAQPHALPALPAPPHRHLRHPWQQKRRRWLWLLRRPPVRAGTATRELNREQSGSGTRLTERATTLLVRIPSLRHACYRVMSHCQHCEPQPVARTFWRRCGAGWWQPVKSQKRAAWW